MALLPMPSIVCEKEPFFSCSSSLESNLEIDMVTPSLGSLEPNLTPMSPSEFLGMSFFHDVVIPSDDDLLEAMTKIDAPIVDLLPQDVVPHQEPSFLLL